jgi:hypothetical protein
VHVKIVAIKTTGQDRIKHNPMKTLQRSIRIVGLGSFLALFLSLGVSQARAGSQSPGAMRSMEQMKTVKQVDELKDGTTMMMVCGACKTTSMTEYKADLPNGKGPRSWMEVGSKHECEHCGGTITVVQGKTKDEMQHNCSKCGEGAAFCCADMAKAAKKL